MEILIVKIFLSSSWNEENVGLLYVFLKTDNQLNSGDVSSTDLGNIYN